MVSWPSAHHDSNEELMAEQHDRFEVQVSGGWDGYRAYLPHLDIEFKADTYDDAERQAVEAARAAGQKGQPPMIDASTRWNCICGQSNPDGRTDCSKCGSIRF